MFCFLFWNILVSVDFISNLTLLTQPVKLQRKMHTAAQIVNI